MKHLLLIGFMWLLGVNPIMAASFEAGDIVHITERVQGDAYLAGEKVNIAQQIEGDLIAAGSRIEVDSNVQQDAILAGADIVINESITDDIRAFGSTITINSWVGGDVVIAGQKIVIGSDAIIEGDLIVAGEVVEIQGVVRGKSRINSDQLVLSGELIASTQVRTRNLSMTGRIVGDTSLVAQTWDLEANALIEGNLVYWSPEEQDLDAWVEGSVQYDESLRQPDDAGKEHRWVQGGFTMIRLIWGSLVIGILVLLLGGFFRKLATILVAGKDYGMSILWGIGFIFLTPIMIGLVFITIIGIPVAIVGLILYIIMLTFTQSTASVLGAYLIRSEGFVSSWLRWVWAVCIYALFLLIGYLPAFVSGLVWFLIATITWGTMIRFVKNR